MEHLRAGTLEEILKRLEVRDLIRCKSVCKYWLSLISDPLFIKSHLKHAYLIDRNNNKLGHRRIAIYPDHLMYEEYNVRDQFNVHHVVGSCNGLLCISPSFNELVIVNPLTREVKKVPNPQIPENKSLCWGFGYDSIKDDYKIVLGFGKGGNCTCFQMFSLKSKVWKVLGEVDHTIIDRPGIFWKGMLHWETYNKSSKQQDVILSFHLTDEKFREIPQPDVRCQLYFGQVRASMYLGIIEDYLCMFLPSSLPRRVWILKDCNKTQPWELHRHTSEIKYDLVHCIKLLKNYIPNKRPLCYNTLYCHNRSFLRAPLFVESLVSPHSQYTEEEEASNEES